MIGRIFGVLTASMLIGIALGGCAPKSTGDLTARAKNYVESMARADFASVYKDFDKTMQSVLPAEKLAEAWTSLAAQVGSFKEQLAVRTEKIDAYDVVYVTCNFDRAKIDVKVVFNNAGQVAGLFFQPAM